MQQIKRMLIILQNQIFGFENKGDIMESLRATLPPALRMIFMNNRYSGLEL